ncbi:hypothetical protein J6590_080380 [Homalodisca vitripennis]|nr:hypothetical protein J6590_080380 [Homalodisca vitripennis]
MKEMENMVDAGLTKYIGLSNFNVRQIERIMENARIKPSNLQIELHIFQQSKEEQEYCERNGILITSYATMGSMGVPEGFFVRKVDNPLTNADVLAIAKTHNKTAAQVLLRHMIQSGIAVIPKSSKLERLKENIDTAAHVLLRHMIQSGIAVIPKSKKVERLKENIDTAAQVLLRHMIQSGIAVIPKSKKVERLKENIDSVILSNTKHVPTFNKTSFKSFSYVTFYNRKIDNPLTNADVLAIAKTHNKTAAQVLLRHMIQSGIAVIPKSSKLERLKENIDVSIFIFSSDRCDTQ